MQKYEISQQIQKNGIQGIQKIICIPVRGGNIQGKKYCPEIEYDKNFK